MKWVLPFFLQDYIPVDQEELRDYVKARLKVFYEEELDVPLVLFNEVLDHVLRIDRWAFCCPVLRVGGIVPGLPLSRQTSPRLRLRLLCQATPRFLSKSSFPVLTFPAKQNFLQPLLALHTCHADSPFNLLLELGLVSPECLGDKTMSYCSLLPTGPGKEQLVNKC